MIVDFIAVGILVTIVDYVHYALPAFSDATVPSPKVEATELRQRHESVVDEEKMQPYYAPIPYDVDLEAVRIVEVPRQVAV
eukprot:CAMPEP_0185265838 /NCGR_PEP_ID=MMETSP1359-20130426/29000_1 /TAXON_ID=552665 /ORGANISM="Bigelowiella longifila, Strain CCMP242" /LENGTH=80 /DNA_ID=CAMNT_0027855349 /DNA_START=211 /DNA_END=453 /DNA_ORIENTATION=-